MLATGTGVDHLAVDMPMAVNPARPRGTRRPCRRDRHNRCRSMRGLGSAHRPHTHGGLAERRIVDRRQVIGRLEDADLARAALAEPCAVALHAVRRGRVASAGDRCRHPRHARGPRRRMCRCDVHHRGRYRPEARARLRALLDVTRLDPDDTAAVAERAAASVFDGAIEASGAPAALEMAFSMAWPGPGPGWCSSG